MIKHIVMWTFKDETSVDDRLEMKSRLEALKGVVPTLLEIEVGMNVIESDAAKDMVLYSEFRSVEDLQTYATHPAHLKVVEFVKPLVCDRAVVDYEV
ncbi:MAG: Dabb family protein [Pontiella sp.]|nr:Dabb family protein [Pontiella sp.]MBT8046756.1 Dabb family protein [Pontiella sp.]NNJ69712.1 Dabb family protein [Kiritimatiellales bacterium]